MQKIDIRVLKNRKFRIVCNENAKKCCFENEIFFDINIQCDFEHRYEYDKFSSFIFQNEYLSLIKQN